MRTFKYTGDQARVFATIQLPSGSTLVANPGQTFDLDDANAAALAALVVEDERTDIVELSADELKALADKAAADQAAAGEAEAAALAAQKAADDAAAEAAAAAAAEAAAEAAKPPKAPAAKKSATT